MTKSTRLMVSALVVVLFVAGCANLACAQDKKDDEVNALLAEKEKLHKRAAEIDAQLALLRGKPRLPREFDGLEYNIDLVDEWAKRHGFELLDIRYEVVSPRFRSVYGIVFSMKVTKDIIEGDAVKTLESLQLNYYKTVKGTDVLVKELQCFGWKTDSASRKIISAGKTFQFHFVTGDASNIKELGVTKCILELK